MTEEQEPAEEGGETEEVAPAAKKRARGLDAIVMREIRRARKLFTDEETAAEASFIVSIANVLAIVELAAAVREAAGVGKEAE